MIENTRNMVDGSGMTKNAAPVHLFSLYNNNIHTGGRVVGVARYRENGEWSATITRYFCEIPPTTLPPWYKSLIRKVRVVDTYPYHHPYHPTTG